MAYVLEYFKIGQESKGMSKVVLTENMAIREGIELMISLMGDPVDKDILYEFSQECLRLKMRNNCQFLEHVFSIDTN